MSKLEANIHLLNDELYQIDQNYLLLSNENELGLQNLQLQNNIEAKDKFNALDLSICQERNHWETKLNKILSEWDAINNNDNLVRELTNLNQLVETNTRENQSACDKLVETDLKPTLTNFKSSKLDKLTGLKSENNTLHSQLDICQDEHDNLLQDITNYKTQITNLEMEISSMENDITQLNQFELIELQNKQLETAKELEQMSNLTRSINKVYDTTKQEYQRINGNLQREKEKIHNLQDGIQKYTTA